MGDPITSIGDESAKRSHAVLEVREGGGLVENRPLEDLRTIIGRSLEATVRLDCETVSRHHAELFRDPFGRWWLRDLGSSNGTKVRGHPIRGAVLNPEEGFEIGKFHLRLVDYGSLSGVGEGEPFGFGKALEQTENSPSTLIQGDREGTQIAMLHEVESPKIDTTHLSLLNNFNHHLETISEGGERLRQLCSLMVRQEFHGYAAVGLRIRRDDEDCSPETLCAPQYREGGRERPPYLSRGLLQTVRKSETPALASHAAEDPGAVALTMNTGAFDMAAVACPLCMTSETMDVLYITLPAEFGTGEWLTLAAHAAQTFAQAETARESRRQHEANLIIERDLARATKIQHGLVPRAPDVPGLSIAIGFQPCRWVGGDYVDVIPLADGRVLLAIADVSGKGLPAALVASGLHSMVNALQRAGTGLVDMMRVLNEHMCEFLADGSFVTMACLTIDPRSGAYELVNAGHPPPAVFDLEGTIHLLQHSQNFPLGIVPYDIVSERGEIGAGHILAMYTDGLTELTDERDEELGVERITGHLRDILSGEEYAGGGGLDLVAKRFTEMLDRYQGDRLPFDDRTFLLVGRP